MVPDNTSGAPSDKTSAQQHGSLCTTFAAILSEFGEICSLSAEHTDAIARCANELDSRDVTLLALDAEHLTIALHAVVEHLAASLSGEADS
jgi:hypothetical protein